MLIKKIKQFEVLYEDFNVELLQQAIYPVIEIGKYELLTMVCILLWNFPAL